MGVSTKWRWWNDMLPRYDILPVLHGLRSGRLKKDGEPRKRAGNRFWSILAKWMDLPDDEQKLTRVSGGCMEF